MSCRVEHEAVLRLKRASGRNLRSVKVGMSGVLFLRERKVFRGQANVLLADLARSSLAFAKLSRSFRYEATICPDRANQPTASSLHCYSVIPDFHVLDAR